METKQNQVRKVLDYIKTHGGITTYEAFIKLGVTRLSARIWDLRHEHNLPIATKNKTIKTRDGKVTSVAYYYLEEDGKDGI